MSTDTNLNQLEQIKKITTVVADTADFESIRAFRPQDATTNPSLVYAATQKGNYSHFLDEAYTCRRKESRPQPAGTGRKEVQVSAQMKTQWPRKKPRKESANSKPRSPNWTSSC